MALQTDSATIASTLTVAGNTVADGSGNINATNYLRVGTLTDPTGAGDAGAGLTGAGRWWYDQSANTLNLYESAGGTLQTTLVIDTVLTTTSQDIIGAINELDAAIAGSNELSEVLANGNITGANNIVVTTGQSITGAAELTLVSTTTSVASLDSGTTGAVNVGTGAAAKAVTVGSVTGAASMTLQSGTGAMIFTAGGVFDVNATGAASIDSTGGAISLGATAGTAIQIGRAALTNDVQLVDGTRVDINATLSGGGDGTLSVTSITSPAGLGLNAEGNSTWTFFDITATQDEVQTADSGTAGNPFSWTAGTGAASGATNVGGAGGLVTWTAGTGGAAVATNAGGPGGAFDVVGGTGGAGTATLAGGAGGTTTVRGGNAGADGGGGTGIGGALNLEGGIGSTAGVINLGIANTSDVNVATVGSATVDIGNASAGAMTLNSGASITVTSGTIVDINSNGASSWINDSGTLTLSTTTSGSLIVNTVGSIDMDSSGAAILIGTDAVAQLIQIGELTTRTEVQIDALLLDFNAGATGITMDSAAGISIDGATASSFTTVAGDLTLVATAGSAIVRGGEAVADAVQLTCTNAAGGIDINAGTTSGTVTIDAGGSISIDATNTTASNFTSANTTASTNTALTILCDNTGATAGDATLNLNATSTNGSAIINIGSTGGLLGFYGATAVVQSAAYTPINVSTDRAYDANATSLNEIADVIGTLIADLQATGIIG